MKHEADQTKFMVETLTNIFNGMSKCGDTITQKEFMAQVDREDMKLFCALIGLHYPDGETLFRLLDVDGSGQLGIDEFVVGFIRLKGGAILIDNFILLQELTSIVKQTMRENSRTLQAVVSVLRFENAGRLASVTETLPESPLAR